jgi:transcription elongation factor
LIPKLFQNIDRPLARNGTRFYTFRYPAFPAIVEGGIPGRASRTSAKASGYRTPYYLWVFSVSVQGLGGNVAKC